MCLKSKKIKINKHKENKNDMCNMSYDCQQLKWGKKKEREETKKAGRHQKHFAYK